MTEPLSRPSGEIDPSLPLALAAFLRVARPDGSVEFSELAVAYGIRRWGNEELRQMYKQDIDVQIAAIGLKVPDPEKGRKIH